MAMTFRPHLIVLHLPQSTCAVIAPAPAPGAAAADGGGGGDGDGIDDDGARDDW